jgi:hypothetical protein
MKTVVRIITVFIILSFMVAGSAPAQSSIVETQPDEIILGGPITQIPNIVQELYPTKSSYGEAVLVIPSTLMKPEELLAITEDMNIMARIFNKQLKNANLIQNRNYDGYFYALKSGIDRGVLTNIFDGRDSLATETMYLEGFGALFLMKVGFPLIAPPKVEEKESEDGTDKVWQQTKKEIYMPHLVKKSSVPTLSLQPYDPAKVEKLKKTLISALKHASNIRALKQDQWVILTVTGSVTNELGMVFLDGQNIEVKLDENGLATTASPLPAVLTICVKKSDIDAFAKGELDFENFRQRTKIFTTFAKFGSEGLAAEPKMDFEPLRQRQVF